MQFLYSIFGNAVCTKFVIHLVNANLVKFVDSNSYINNLVCLPYHLSNAGKDFTVVDFYCDTDAETGENSVDNLHQLHFVEQRIRAYDIGVTLIELAITAFLRTVCTPDRLYLIPLERQLKLLPVHDDIACKGNGEVVAQSLFTQTRCKMQRIAFVKLFVSHLSNEISGIEDLEKQFVALFTVFSHKGLQCLHCRCFYLLKTVKGIDFSDCIEDIVAFRHFNRREITRPFGYAWFCHNVFLLFVL